MTSLISVNNLSRFYGEHCAVNDISFSLEKGDVLGFLGPNGAGKSTTMRMLTGNLAPHHGSIRINGYDLIDQPMQAKCQLGYLPEYPPLYRDLTVDEYLSYCARLHQVDNHEIADKAELAMRRCDLLQVRKRLIRNLSKGFQQRVGIAQAILHQPAVILLDEPTVGLDPIQIMDIRELIAELGENHGIILCTHILPEVQAVCNRVQIINRGAIVYHAELGQGDDPMTRQYRVTLAHDPHARDTDDVLSNDQGLFTLIDSREDCSYIIESDAPAQAITAYLCEQGLGLKHFSAHADSPADALEATFVSIVSGGATASGAVSSASTADDAIIGEGPRP